jgi:hypothetical protein
MGHFNYHAAQRIGIDISQDGDGVIGIPGNGHDLAVQQGYELTFVKLLIVPSKLFANLFGNSSINILVVHCSSPNQNTLRFCKISFPKKREDVNEAM